MSADVYVCRCVRRRRSPNYPRARSIGPGAELRYIFMRGESERGASPQETRRACIYTHTHAHRNIYVSGRASSRESGKLTAASSVISRRVASLAPPPLLAVCNQLLAILIILAVESVLLEWERERGTWCRARSEMAFEAARIYNGSRGRGF